MEFRLLYKGPLSSQRGGGKGGSILKEKQSIRKQLHPQLRELWQQHWHLQRQLKYSYYTNHNTDEVVLGLGPPTEADRICDKFKEGKFRFLPLITEDNGLACKLDILFLRRDSPGNLIESGGDIDNRIKVLFDSLKVPDRGSINELSPDQGEDPFFCLLEDDRLITEISITTDRLLFPLENEEHIHDVMLVVSVKTKVIDPNKDNSEFLGD